MDPFWPTQGALIFLPGVKKRFCKISLDLELKKGEKYFEGSVCRFFLHLLMFIGWYSKKTDENKHKKVILADFDPFLHLTPSKQAFLCHFFNFQVHFWPEGTLKTLLLILYGYSPYM